MTSQKKAFDPPLQFYVADVNRTHLFGSRVISKLATSETDMMYIFKGEGGYRERTHKDLDGRRICFFTEKEAYEALIRYVEEDLEVYNNQVKRRLDLLHSRIANSEDVDIVLHQTCMKERK